jgi:hypothetical protein
MSITFDGTAEVTCRTPGCGNEGIPITVPTMQGEVPPVVCGVCGAPCPP